MNATEHVREVWTLRCMLCNREAGQVVDGAFRPNNQVRAPLASGRQLRCGECGGNVLRESDDALLATGRSVSRQTRRRVAARVA